jgi:predicted SAM-dependent methyltransferase
MNDLYVQYGCGLAVPSGWLNFDIGLPYLIRGLPLMGKGMYWGIAHLRKWSLPDNVRYGNIVHGLPIPANSCKGVYCSHVLEHLSLDEARKALRNTHRILQRNGLFRIVVPDLERLARDYLQDAAADAAHRFIRSAYLGHETWPKGLHSTIKNWLLENHRHRHKWMWDRKSLEIELLEAGFTGVRYAQYGDSSDQRFQEVEDRERWENAVAFECGDQSFCHT